MPACAPGAIPSPNIWRSPAIYEMENNAVDPDGLINAAMRELAPPAADMALDIGCGTGFHLPQLAATAQRVVGIDPHPALVTLARRRCRDLPTVSVQVASAQVLPVPDRSVDLSHARWAYFFGPGCEPGLAELARVMRGGGVSVVIDNDATRSTFGRWFRTALPSYDAATVERFWSQHGWQRHPLTIRWHFDRRVDLEAVVGIEFAPAHARRILAEHRSLDVDYAINLWWRRW